MMAQRDAKLDGLKFIMIFLVVLGHLEYYDYHLGLNQVIYSFHMPVFVFLSGYFTPLSPSRQKQLGWLKKTFLIYIGAQLASFLLTVGLEWYRSGVTGAVFDRSVVTWDVLWVPRFALWYLLCLIYWRVAVWHVFSRIGGGKMLIISAVLAFVVGFVPIDEVFSFQRAFAFFPFFVLGIVFRRRAMLQQLEKMPYAWCLVAFLLALVAARLLPTYMPRVHYAEWTDALKRVVQSGLGAVLCLLIVRLSRVKWVERLAWAGAFTLWIYIGHTFLVKTGYVLFPILGVRFELFGALALAGVYCAFFIMMAKLSGRLCC